MGKATMTWRIYGAEGHRQRESFNNSYTLDFSTDTETRVITVLNSDVTGTNEFSKVIITRNTFKECKEELEGQLSDGIFENSRVGRVVEV